MKKSTYIIKMIVYLITMVLIPLFVGVMTIILSDGLGMIVGGLLEIAAGIYMSVLFVISIIKNKDSLY